MTSRRTSRAASKELSDIKFALDESAIVAFTDQRGVIASVNDKFCEISKYSRDEVLGQDHRIINSGFHPKEFIRNIWTTIAEGKTWHGELRNKAKDGSIYWVDTTIVSFLDNAGRPYQHIAISFDITESKLAEDRIRKQAELLEKTRDAVIVCDLDYNILFWNKGAEKIYGWEASDVLGKTIIDLAISVGREELDRLRSQFEESGKLNHIVRREAKDGRQLIIDARWTLVRNDHGQPDYILVTQTDISEQKRAEEHLLRVQRMESIGTLAGGIAHDLNNILFPVVMGVEMLEENEPLSPDGRKWVSLIKDNAERGTELVKQVLSFARGDQGERLPIQLKHVAKELIGVLRETLPKSIVLKYDLDPDLEIVTADPTQVHQVLMNLCLNARDAMPGGGTLTVTLSNETIDESYHRMDPTAIPGRYAMISVEDTGHGMSPSTIERIFDPFFTTKEIGKGTGLGLSTVLSIVEGHGGFLNVTSAVGKGSKFSIYFPTAASAEFLRRPEPDDMASSGANRLILIVDDESDVREIMRSALEKAGYRTLTASDGAEAIALFADNKAEIEAVITDVSMPLIDGPTMARAIRKIVPDAKIVAMSGLFSPPQIAQLEDAGVSYFLNKPFTAKKLLTDLTQLLAGKNRRPLDP